nr:hypothetical protein CFP56_64633 [Quercus suber]
MHDQNKGRILEGELRSAEGWSALSIKEEHGWEKLTVTSEMCFIGTPPMVACDRPLSRAMTLKKRLSLQWGYVAPRYVVRRPLQPLGPIDEGVPCSEQQRCRLRSSIVNEVKLLKSVVQRHGKAEVVLGSKVSRYSSDLDWPEDLPSPSTISDASGPRVRLLAGSSYCQQISDTPLPLDTVLEIVWSFQCFRHVND